MPVDGDIVLSAGLNANDAISAAEALTEEIRGIFEEASGTHTSTAFKSLQTQMDNALIKSQKIIDSMEELASTQLPSDEYSGYEQELSSIDEQFTELMDRRRELEQSGQVDTQEYEELGSVLQELEERGEAVRQVMQDMRTAGTDTISGTQTEEYQRLGEQLNQVNNRLVILKQRALESGNTASQSARNASSAYNRLGTTIGSVSKAASKTSFGTFLGNQIKKLTGHFKSFDKVADNSKKNLQGFFKTFIKYAFGVRSFFFLFRKLRSALIDGFGNLAQVSQPFNTAMSSMQNALANLKSSFASAFAPIIQAVAPAITTFINLIANAIDAVGKLIAALTGQSTYIKYIATQQDYAQSVADTAKSANNASKATDKANKSAQKYQKTLAGFDDVEILKNPTSDSDSGSGGTGGGGGAGGKLSPVAGVVNMPLSDAFKDLSDKIKEAWKKADFTEIGTIVGTKLKNALDSIDWTKIRYTLHKIAKSAATFLNGYFATPGLFSSIGKTIAQAFNSALYFVYTFVSNLHWKSIGKAVVDSLIGFFKNFDWKLFGATLYELINGLLEFLQGAVEEIPWADIPEYITNAIADFMRGFKWKKLIDDTIGLIISAIDGLIEMISGKEGENKDSPLVTALQALQEAIGKIDSKLFEDLGEAIGKVVEALGPIAEGFGAGFIAFISQLIELGVEVISTLSEALDGIGEALGDMDSETLTKVGEALGIIAGAFMTMKLAWGIITGISGILTGIGTAASTAAGPISAAGTAILGVSGAALGATFGLGAFLALLKTETLGADEPEEYLESLGTTFGVVETAVRMLGTRYGLTTEKQDALLESMKGISETDGPAVQTAIGNIEQGLNDVGISTDEFKDALSSVLSVGGTPAETTLNNLSGYIGDIGKSADDASTDTTGLSEAFGLFSAPNFSAILKLALLKGTVDALGSSGKLTEEDTAKLQKTLDNYDSKPTEENMGKIQKAMEDAGVSAGDLNLAYIDAVKTLPTALKGEYLKLANSITTNNTQIKTKAESGGKDLVEGTISGIEEKEEDLQDKVASVVDDSIIGPFDNAADIQSPSKVMKERGQYLLDGLKLGMENRKPLVVAFMKVTVNDLLTTITTFASKFTSSGTTAMKNFYNGISGQKESLGQLISDVTTYMEDSFDLDNWEVLGYNAAVGIYNGFISVSGRLQTLVYQVARGMLATAQKALDIGSPSKRFAWIGKMTMEGLAGGVANNADQPVDAISDVTESMEEAAEAVSIDGTFLTNMSQLLDEFDLILTEFSDTIIERFDTLLGSLGMLNGPMLANVPNIVQGKIAPYSLNSTQRNSELAGLKNAIDMLNNDRLTRSDITDIVTTALRNLPIELYIGDEQIARHANNGNAKLSRRFS